MYRKTITMTLCLLGLLMSVVVLGAKSNKENRGFAMVNMGQVFNEYNQAQKAREKIEKEQKQWQEKINKLQEDIANLQEELKKGGLQEKQKTEKEQLLQTKSQDLAKLIDIGNRQLIDMDKEIGTKIREEIDKELKAISKEKDLFIIFNAESIAYSTDEIPDITDELIKRLNR